MLSEKLAHQSGGIFFLRIEDTDKKREVVGTVDMIIKALNRFGINVDEGFLSDDEQIGNYGPYIQSQRENIYKVFVRKLLLNNMAYVCFATPEELENITNIQTQRKELIGYRKE
jgi:glutamyl-tRNA synthetase